MDTPLYRIAKYATQAQFASVHLPSAGMAARLAALAAELSEIAAAAHPSSLPTIERAAREIATAAALQEGTQ
jgi:hypothetical protein